MRRFTSCVASVRYLGVVGAVSALLAALAAFGWSSYETLSLVAALLHGDAKGIPLALVHIMDSLLIAAALLIFALGFYELFVGGLPLPEGLVVADIEALKNKLVGIIFVILAGSFLERLETSADAKEILYVGVAIAVVNGTLAWFRGGKPVHSERRSIS